MSTHTNYHLRNEISDMNLSTSEELLEPTAMDSHPNDIVKLIIGGIIGNDSIKVLQISKFKN